MRSITLKLTLGFLVVCLVEAVLVAVFARQATHRLFSQFIENRVYSDYVANALNYYQLHGSWEGVEQWLRPLNVRQDEGKPSRRRGQHPASLYTLIDQQGVVRIPSTTYRIGEKISVSQWTQGTPLMIGDTRIGTVLRTGERQVLHPAEVRHLERTYRALLYAVTGALGIALVWGWLFARTLTRPLQQLTAAASAIAQGQLKQQLPIRAKDELGTLTAAFNQMSTDLDKATALRRQMTADIAHELRTPLTTLTGYLEGMCEGVLDPTPQRLEMMYAGAKHLDRLIQDLRTLSLADAGELSLQRQWIAPSTLLGRIRGTFDHQAQEKGIELQVQAEPSLPECWIDPVRMEQVLANLVSNALRYTPEGGHITLRAEEHSNDVHLMVEDTGPGIPEEALSHIFERFYRIEQAREQEDGASGIGLAIVKSLVDIHGAMP